MKREDVIEHAIGLGVLVLIAFVPVLAVVIAIVIGFGCAMPSGVSSFGRAVFGFAVRLVLFLIVLGVAANYAIR